MSATQRLLLVILVFVLPACRDGGSSAEDAWEPFNSPAGGFRAEFPGEPVRQTQRLPGATGSSELVVFTSGTDTEAVSVAYVDYPAAPPAEQVETVLDAAAEGLATAVQGRNLVKESTSFLERDALDFSVEAPPQKINGRAFLDGARLYVLQVVLPQNAAESSIRRLASSFELVPRTPATPEVSPDATSSP